MPARLRRTLLATAMAATLTAAAACGGASDDQQSASGPLTLVVKTFSQFGYDALYKQYEASHPGVTIKEENIGKLGDYTPKLQQWMTAGSGAGDVVALEEGIISQYIAKPDKFVNLLDKGADSLKPDYLDWKWNQALTSDGKTLIGLGTDIGAQGMCYRKDLFQKAGLPVDRDQVGALWPTWDAYLATGKRFLTANTGAKFYDSSSGMYQNILMQQGDHTYYDKANTFVADSNPAVRSAYDQTVGMIQAGLSANLDQYSPQWNAGFKKGTFATIACPSWMLATIQKQAGPENADKWDVAKVPGNGAVRGGSFLGVPKQSKHQDQAVELVKFLTSAKGQIGAFQAKGNFPSSPQAIDDPVVQGLTNAYFGNAPVGKIFGASAKAVKPVYLGPANVAIGDRFTNALLAVEQGKLQPAEAWSKAIDEAKRLVK